MTIEQAAKNLENAINNYGRPSPQWRAALRAYNRALKQAAK